MDKGDLGKTYKDGEIIMKEGDKGDCMYVIQSGKVDVIHNKNGREFHLSELGESDFFGEMALFEQEKRSATVRAKGETRILTVDKKTLLRRIHSDPSLAFRIIEKTCSRLRYLDNLYSKIRASDRRQWETRPDDWEFEKYKK